MEFKVTLSLGPVAGFLDQKIPVSNDFEKGFPSQVFIKTRKTCLYAYVYIPKISYFENKNQLSLIALRFLDEQLLLTEFVSCQGGINISAEKINTDLKGQIVGPSIGRAIPGVFRPSVTLLLDMGVN